MSTARRRTAWLLALSAAANVLFLHWLWRRFSFWGVWDWDFTLALYEAGRKSILDFGQLPLWNPWMGGGGTLAGHPLANNFAPSFLLVLVLGVPAGVKVVVALYLWIAQVGSYRLARAHGLDILPSILAALVFGWGGAFTQHLTHGHIGWIGYAWVPFVLLAAHRATERLSAGALAAGGVFVGLSWLDGGPYNYVIVPAFVGTYVVVLAVRQRTLRPIVALAIFGGVGAGLAAVEIAPVAEMALAYPRPTPEANIYYRAPFEPTVAGTLYQAFLSRNQQHDPEAWMPYRVNVGAYVGWLPLLLALAGLIGNRVRAWPLAVLLLFWLLLCLGNTLPVDLWALVHRLPGFDSMQVPMRFRILVLLLLGLLSGTGLQTLLDRSRVSARGLRIAAVAIVAVVALDLFSVNARVWRVAFAVPPIETEERAEWTQLGRSPYERTYGRTAVEPVFSNWPSALFPTVRENTGVLFPFRPKAWPQVARASVDVPAEVFAPHPSVEIVDTRWTPNRIVVTVRGNGGVVAVNQNHDDGWTVAEGEATVVRAAGGLLAVQVPPGNQTVALVFRPWTFSVGALASVATALLAVGIWVRRKLPTPARTSPGPRMDRGEQRANRAPG